MVIKFDKGLSTERSLEIKSVFEHPIQNRLTASNDIVIEEGGTFPDYSEFINNPSFTTVEINDGSISVPVQGVYNNIADFTTNYYAEGHVYNVNIVLGYQ